jgi:hypothetical protein
MKYKDITKFPDAVDLEMEFAKAQQQQPMSDDAKRRLRQLNQERLQRVARAVHRELDRYLDVEQLERLNLENRPTK